MKNPENRLLPMSAIAAMLVVSSTIVGLAYWVGDAIAPGLATVVQVSTKHAVSAGTRAAPAQTPGPGALSDRTEREKGVHTAPLRAERITVGAGR